jgi:hypothetical protein
MTDYLINEGDLEKIIYVKDINMDEFNTSKEDPPESISEVIRKVEDRKNLVVKDNGKSKSKYLSYTYPENEFIQNIYKKVESFGNSLNKTNIINCEDFNKVYITSDIHADYRKFLQILLSNNIITYKDFEFPIVYLKEIGKGMTGSNDDIIGKGMTSSNDDIIDKGITGSNDDIIGKGMTSSNDDIIDYIYQRLLNIYDIQLITKVVWNNKNELLVILGDLVDGKRDDFEVIDTIGNFELLLHIFIHNLRIKAKEKYSDVIFTFGNHDMDSVYRPIQNLNDDDKIQTKMYTEYVHATCKTYFNNAETRVNALRQFYNNSPYLFLKFMHNVKPNNNNNNNTSFLPQFFRNKKISPDSNVISFICVHAGIHSMKLTGYSINEKKNITVNGNNIEVHKLLYEYSNSISVLDNLQKELISKKETSITPDVDKDLNIVTWDRNYFKQPQYYDNNKKKKYICDDNDNNCRLPTENPYDEFNCAVISDEDPLIIIGHCITNNLNFRNNNDYIDCNNNLEPGTKGCVVVGCRHTNNNNPKIVLVDTASSNAFRFGKPVLDINKKRGAEILVLTKGDTIIDKTYYTFTRVLDSTKVKQVYPDPTPSSQGGRSYNKTVKRINKKRNSNRPHKSKKNKKKSNRRYRR